MSKHVKSTPEKVLKQIKEEILRLHVGELKNNYIATGFNSILSGKLEQFIAEMSEQITDNEPRVQRATSSTLVFLIKKYKANGNLFQKNGQFKKA